MNKKITKEDLQNKIGELGIRNSMFVEQDVKIREELSRIFGFSRRELNYGRDEEKVTILSWIQIAHEIGRLQAKRDYISFQDRIEVIERDLLEIHTKNSEKK